MNKKTGKQKGYIMFEKKDNSPVTYPRYKSSWNFTGYSIRKIFEGNYLVIRIQLLIPQRIKNVGIYREKICSD